MDDQKPKPNDFAKTFLDLWQEQLNTAMTDPAALSAMMSFWRQYQDALGKTHAPPPPGWGMPHDPFAAAQPYASPQHSAYAPAGHAGYGLLVELAGRVAACEARIAQLEQALAAQNPAPAGGKRNGGKRKPRPRPA